MVNTYHLKNGIQVVMEDVPHYRSVSFGVWVKAGSVNEDDRTNGMAHVIEHMMFKGTGRRSAREIADAMTEIGGNVDAYTTKEYTCYYAKTLHEHLYYAIDILADMLTNSLIDEDDLQKELGVIAEEIDMYDDSPEDIVHEQLQKAVWKGHPLGYLISGDKSVVQKFHREDVLDFMTQYYTADRMVITLSGFFDETETLKVLEQAFANVSTGDGTKKMDNADIPCAVYQPSLYMQHKDIEQVHLIMAYPSIQYASPERYVLSLANNIIGGNVNSRLFQTIREEMGIAYAIYSYGGSYEKGGLFHIYAAVQPDQIQPAVRAVMDVLEELKRQPVSERELRIVKEQIKTELIISEESTYNRMSSYGKYYIYQDLVVPTEKVIASLEAVTAEQICHFINQYFDAGTVSLSLVGDLSNMTQASAEQFWKEMQGRQR
jgi:predicted Zn-dependent peptidase